MPEKFNELPLILWRDENWIVNPETRGAIPSSYQ
jgi:hypothetical protein